MAKDQRIYNPLPADQPASPAALADTADAGRLDGQSEPGSKQPDSKPGSNQGAAPTAGEPGSPPASTPSPATVSDAGSVKRPAHNIGTRPPKEDARGAAIIAPVIAKDSISSSCNWDFPRARGVFATAKLEQLSAA